MKQLLLGLAVLSLSACNKDDPQASLPPATQVGANTGGCLINGQAFVATGWGTSNILSNPIPALFGGFAFDSVYYVRFAGQYKGSNAYVMLFLRPDFPGTYKLNKTTQYYPQGDPRRIQSHATFYYADNSNEVYVTDAQHTGQVTLTRADLKNGVGIGAGTFEFTAASQADPSKTVTITDGRFDRKQ